MPSLVLVFVALIAVIASPNKVESSPAQGLDLSKILELVQQHRLNTAPSKPRKLQLQIVSSDSSSDSDDSSTDSSEPDDTGNKRFSRIRNDRIIDLLQKGAKDKINNDRLTYSKAKKTYRQVTEKADDSESILAIPLLEKESVIDLIETVAKDNKNRDRLTYSKGKKTYVQKSDKFNDSDNNRLARERIINLIKAVANLENNKNDHIKNRKEKTNYGQKSYLYRSKKYDNTQNVNNNVQKQILEKLLSQPSNDEVIQKIPKKRLTPNQLTPTVTMEDVKKYYENQNKNNEVSKNYEITGLENYSKIYIVLNPQAVQNSKSKNSLKELISKVLSLSSPTSKRVPEVKEKPRRYKGFVVNDDVPVRRFKMISDRLVDGGKKLDPLLVPGEITAIPI